MKTYTLGALASVVLAVSCGVACSSSSASDNGSDAATCDPCDDGGGGTTVGAGHDSNPDGVPYPAPAGGYGRTARTGNTPGSVIQNFKFLGYPTLTGDGTYPSSLSTISLADYYDPCNKRYKMIHLSVAAVWCVPCNEETTAVVAANSQLVSEGVIVLQALDDGPVEGTGATQGDLQNWVRNHDSNFPEMLDPNLQNYGGFFNAAAIPWNADLDPRTMEILDSSEGWSGNVSSEVSLSVVPAQPSYPVPASAQCP
jgi:hypothetical protein